MHDFDSSTLDYQDIPGTITAEEGRKLFDLAYDGPGGNEPIFEINSFKGRATAYLAKGCSIKGRGMVFALDDYTRYPKEILFKKEVSLKEVLQKNLYLHRVSPWMQLLDGPPPEAVERWHMPIRMLCITPSQVEGGNLEEQVFPWDSCIIPGGILVVPSQAFEPAGYDLKEKTENLKIMVKHD